MKKSCLVLIGLLVGCQDGFSVDADQGNFCDEVAEVACHNMYQCCTEDQIESDLGVTEPRTEVQCREDKKRECIVANADVRDSLKAGRAHVRCGKFQRILRALAAPDDTCATYVTERPWMEACKTAAFLGTVATGATCFFSHDCQGGPTASAARTRSVSGTDRRVPVPAGFCAGLYCGTGGTCVQKLAEGAPCTSNSHAMMRCSATPRRRRCRCARREAPGLRLYDEPGVQLG